MSKISCFKSVLGEDIIGNITENLDGSIVVSKPMLIMINPNGQGGFSVGLFPYLMYAEKKEFTYRREQYLFLFDAVSDLHNEYLRATTGLVIPQAETPKLSLI